MMFTRAWRADFNLDDSEGRIVSGIAVPFDSPTAIAERGLVFEESFKRGAFKDTIAKRGDRVKVLGFHDSRQMPLGRPTTLDEQARGLYMEARISDTRDGNDALTLVRDKVLDGFSVGFGVPDGGDTWNRDMTERQITNAHLYEVSLVNFPAYDRARVESVRSANVTGAMGGPLADGAGAGPHSASDLHQFDDNGGTGLCVVCNLTAGEGNHGMLPTEEAAASLDLSQRYTLELERLHLLRVQFV